MAEYLAPGVYVEEFNSGMKPMEGVSTSTAGFIGMTERGTLTGTPSFVGSYMEFQRKFGGYLPKNLYGERRYLPMAVEQFFANGGSRCFVVRVLDDTSAQAASSAVGGITFTAANVGAWGNNVTIACKRSSINNKLCTLIVSCPGYEESYTDVSLAADAENELEKILEKSNLVRAAIKPEVDRSVGLFDLMLPQKAMTELLAVAKTAADAATKAVDAVAQISEESAESVKTATETIRTALDGLSAAADTLVKKFEAQSAATAEIAQAASEAVKAAQVIDKAATEVQELLEPPVGDVGEAKTALEKARQPVSGALSAMAEVAAALKKLADGIPAESPTPQPNSSLSAVQDGNWAVLHLAGGKDCAANAKPSSMVDATVLKGTDGGPGKRTGLCAFQDIPEISIIAAPGVTDPSEVQAVLNHCETMSNRVCILDMPAGMNQVTDLQQYRSGIDSSFAAMYHPWIQVFDPLDKRSTFIPPSGSVAGIYARTDNTRGIHKAPANEVVRNCTGLQTLFGMAEQAMLNPVGVNLIRNIPGQGIRIWGARTCSSDSSWKYVNVRRLFIFLEESIRRNTGWAVFEPNDQTLWTKVYNSITSFLGTQWRNGALAGASESEAFFVNIGLGSSMTQDDVLNGRMICVIGVAPSRPAEFIIFRISQIMEADS